MKLDMNSSYPKVICRYLFNPNSLGEKPIIILAIICPAYTCDSFLADDIL